MLLRCWCASSTWGEISAIRLQLLMAAVCPDSSSSPVCLHLCNPLQLELTSIYVKVVIWPHFINNLEPYHLVENMLSWQIKIRERWCRPSVWCSDPSWLLNEEMTEGQHIPSGHFGIWNTITFDSEEVWHLVLIKKIWFPIYLLWWNQIKNECKWGMISIGWPSSQSQASFNLEHCLWMMNYSIILLLW